MWIVTETLTCVCVRLSSCCGFSGRKKPVSKCPLANVVCRDLSGLQSVEMTVLLSWQSESVFVCCLFSSTLYITRLCHGNCCMTIGCDPVKGMKSHVNFLEPEVSRIAICNLRIGAYCRRSKVVCVEGRGMEVGCSRKHGDFIGSLINKWLSGGDTKVHPWIGAVAAYGH